LKYFHHVLRGKAKRFYAKEIQGRSFSFHEAALRIREEYNSVSRQKRIANKLRSLRISQFLVDGSNPCDALEELHETISRLAPQGPMHLRAEMNAKEYLRNAIIGYSWAKGPLNRDSAEDLSYQELYSQLQAAIQQEIEEKAAVLLDQSIGRSAPALLGFHLVQVDPFLAYCSRPRRSMVETTPGEAVVLLLVLRPTLENVLVGIVELQIIS